MAIPESEIKLRDEIAALKERIKNLREERNGYRVASETFVRAMNVLTIEFNRAVSTRFINIAATYSRFIVQARLSSCYGDE